MNADHLVRIATFLSGTAAMILSYYAISLQQLNSAQMDRLLGIRSESGAFYGLRRPVFLSALQMAAFCLNGVFIVLLAYWLLVVSRSDMRIMEFVVIVFAFEIASRFFLPRSMPLRQRNALKSAEKAVFAGCAYAFYPLAVCMEFVSAGIRKALFPRTDSERISEAEETIKSIIDAGEKEGIFREDDGELLQSIVDFSETVVREVMTPRIDLKCIEIDKSLSEFVDIVIQTGYSKIPAYKQRIDNIEGVLYAKDVLQFWNARDEDIRLEDIVRRAYFIPETKKVRDLLREFQKEKLHLAIVVDEYGGVAGVVTIEDLLEEIVGEIHDEYDVEQKMLQVLGENTWLVDARIDLDELEDVLDIEFPRDSYESLGGFLFDQMGHVPRAGETHVFQDLKIEIKEADKRRIKRVLIRRIARSPSSEEENEEDDGQ